MSAPRVAYWNGPRRRARREWQRGAAIIAAHIFRGVFVGKYFKLPVDVKDIGAVIGFAVLVIVIMFAAKRLPVVGSKL